MKYKVITVKARLLAMFFMCKCDLLPLRINEKNNFVPCQYVILPSLGFWHTSYYLVTFDYLHEV